MMDRGNENAPSGWRPGEALKISAGNRPGKSTGTSAPLRIAIGGPAWRRARGLCTWRDSARRWRALRYRPAGARSPLPETLLPPWRGARHA